MRRDDLLRTTLLQRGFLVPPELAQRCSKALHRQRERRWFSRLVWLLVRQRDLYRRRTILALHRRP